MEMRRLLILLGMLSLSRIAWAAPDTTMSITPSAVSGTTITASDENTRNNAISTAYNSHSHTDITKTTVNTYTVGDGTAGNKQICGDAVTDRCFRWDDTANLWLVQQPTTTYNEILTASGTAGLTPYAVLLGDGVGAVRSVAGLGTAAQVLTSNGAGTAPTFQTSPAGPDISCRAYNSANISISDATLTALTFDSERFDTDTIHSTTVNTSRLTATTAGKYLIIGDVQWANNGTGQRNVQIRLNGSINIGQTIFAAQGVAPDHEMIVATYYSLIATDYVELMVYQNSGGALNVQGVVQHTPEFMMVKVP